MKLKNVGVSGSVCNLGTYELYERIIKETKENGGCSINSKREKPTSGYMVGVKSFGSDLAEMLNYELEDNEYYGSWINPHNEEMEFDISINIMDLNEAIEIGNKHNQISIYDLDNDCSIYLK